MSFITFFQNKKIMRRLFNRVKAVHRSRLSSEVLNNAEYKINNTLYEMTKDNILENIADYFKVALWVKDESGNFRYSNSACDQMILKTTSFSFFTRNGDYPKDALADLCMAGDKKVINEQRDIRSIEFAMYDSGALWIDTYKSPFGGQVLKGSFGSAINILSIIPDDVVENFNGPSSVEISLDLRLSSDEIGAMFKLIKERENDKYN